MEGQAESDVAALRLACPQHHPKEKTVSAKMGTMQWT